MNKAEKMHQILVRLADEETYYHNEKESGKVLLELAGKLSEASKVRLYDFIMED